MKIVDKIKSLLGDVLKTPIHPKVQLKGVESAIEFEHTSNSAIDPEDVIDWLVTQPNANGTLYLENVVRQYMGALRAAPAKLQIPVVFDVRSVFTCHTPDELNAYWDIFRAAPNYKQVNSSTSGMFSAGMGCYMRYLQHLSDELDVEKPDVVRLIERHNLEHVDERDSGGALWVIGGRELSHTMLKLRDSGFPFTFKIGGGRSSDYRDAWWYKSSETVSGQKSEESEEAQPVYTDRKGITNSAQRVDFTLPELCAQTRPLTCTIKGQTVVPGSRVRSPNTRFSKLGVPVGAELIFTKGRHISCVVLDASNQVEYNGKAWAISALAMHLLGVSSANGFCHFSYEGETLWERRSRLERAGKQDEYQAEEMPPPAEAQEAKPVMIPLEKALAGEVKMMTWLRAAIFANMPEGFSPDMSADAKDMLDVTGSIADQNSAIRKEVADGLKQLMMKFTGYSEEKAKHKAPGNVTYFGGHWTGIPFSSRSARIPKGGIIGLEGRSLSPSTWRLFRSAGTNPRVAEWALRVAEGESEQTIAQESGLTVSTVKQYIHNYVVPAAPAKPALDPEVIEKLTDVLSTHFANGYRLNSPIELARFRSFAAEDFGEEIELPHEELKRYISACGTTYDGKVYAVSAETKERIKELVDEYFSDGAQAIFFAEFYAKNENWLFEASVVSEDMLIDILRRLFPKLSFTQTYFGYTDASVFAALEGEILRVWGDDVLLTYGQLAERLRYIPLERIKSLLGQNGDFIWSSVETFSHVSRIEITDEERQVIREAAVQECNARGYASITDLPFGEIEERNYEVSITAVHNVSGNAIRTH